MDLAEAQATLARVTPPPLTELTIEETDNPHRELVDALIDFGRRLTGDEPPANVIAVTDRVPAKAARITATQQYVTRNDSGELITATLITTGGVNIAAMDAEELIDAVALLLLNLAQQYFRQHYLVDGKAIYKFGDDTGEMAWEAFQAYATNHPLPVPRIHHDGVCDCDEKDTQ